MCLVEDESGKKCICLLKKLDPKKASMKDALAFYIKGVCANEFIGNITTRKQY